MVELLTTAIPFLFVLAVVYGALEVSDIFKNRGVKGIIAIVVALFAVTNEQLVEFIYLVLPYAAVLFIVVFFLAFIVSIFKGRGREGGRKVNFTLLAVAIALVLLFLAGQGESLDFLNIGDSNLIAIIGFILIVLIFYAAYRYEAKASGQAAR